MSASPYNAPELKERWCQNGMPRGWSVRVTLENGNDFDGLSRFGGTVLAETGSRFGVLTQWNFLREGLDGRCHDQITIGDFNLTYRFAQSEWAMLRAGIGARTSFDHGHNDWGVNFHYGADFFPMRPWVFSGSLDAGTLGSTGVF